MSTLQTDFERLEQKLQQLIQLQHSLVAEKAQLEQQVANLTAQKNELQEKATDLAQQLQAAKLSQGNVAEQDRKEMEKKINQYIREIDRCIAQLGE
jgi:uncharacterized coiled-coil DUF342 family protein